MPLLANIDTIVHLHSFTNVDIMFRGVYYIRVSLMDIENTQHMLQPVASFSECKSTNSYVKHTQVPIYINRDELGKHHIQDHFFGTRMFGVRYRYEHLELNEGCHFQIEKPISFNDDQMSLTAGIRVRFELMRSEVEPPWMQAANGQSAKPPPITLENFKSLAVHEVILRQLDFGTVHEYIPITFGYQHFVKLEVLLHLAVTRVRYLDEIVLVDASTSSTSGALDRQTSCFQMPMFSGFQPGKDPSFAANGSKRILQKFTDFVFPGTEYDKFEAKKSKLAALYTAESQVRKYISMLLPVVESLEAIRSSLNIIEAECTGATVASPLFKKSKSPSMPNGLEGKDKVSRTPNGIEALDKVSSTATNGFATPLSSSPRDTRSKSVCVEPSDSSRHDGGRLRLLSDTSRARYREDKLAEMSVWSSHKSKEAIAPFKETPASRLHPDKVRNVSWFSSTKYSSFEDIQEEKQVPKPGSTVLADISLEDSLENPAFHATDSTPPIQLVPDSSRRLSRSPYSNFSKKNQNGTINLYLTPVQSAVENKRLTVEEVADTIERDLSALSETCAKEWKALSKMLPTAVLKMSKQLSQRWLQQQQEQWEHALFVRSRHALEMPQPDGCDFPDLQDILAYRHIGAQRLLLYNIQDLMTLGEASDQLCCTMELYFNELEDSPENDCISGVDLNGQKLTKGLEKKRSRGISVGDSSGAESPGHQTRNLVLFYKLGQCFKSKGQNEQGDLSYQQYSFSPNSSLGPGFGRRDFLDVVSTAEDTYLPAWQGNPLRLLSATPDVSAADTEKKKPAPHIIVLQHGLHGGPFDMCLIADYITLMLPDNLILNSAANQDESDVGLDKMGELLADEILKYVFSNCPAMLMNSETAVHGKLSFIAHSAGGLIIRAALARPEMQPLLPRLHTLVTLSTPHLGNIFSSSFLVSAGMHVLNIIASKPNGTEPGLLCQLLCQDALELEETYLYKLSKSASIQNFQHVVLVWAHEDKYVPKHSALVQLTPDMNENTKQGKAYAAMVDNILSKISPERLHRINVFSNFEEKNIDTFIGRAAHISYLDSPRILNMLLFAILGKLS